MSTHDSFALLLTPAGSAAIAVVRLVGTRVKPFLQSHFSSPLRTGACVHGMLRDGTTVIDDPVVVLAADGMAADINLHGGPWVVRAAQKLFRREGFEVVDRAAIPLADAAVDADAELEREILSHLPLATTELALSELLRQQEAWRAFDELPRAERLADAAEMLEDRGLRWLLHRPRVAIVGAPNVGKSTLANRLFGQERSITADLPGTTRDWVGEVANIDGLAITLVDTPGMRETGDHIEASAIERARHEVAAADFVLLVLDATRPMNVEQEDLLRQFPHALVVMNKCDMPTAFAHLDAIEVSAATGHGLDDLKRWIRDQSDIERRRGKPRVWSDRRAEYLRQLLAQSD